jgi:hypothetical protein
MKTSFLSGLKIEAIPNDVIDQVRSTDRDVSDHRPAHLKAKGGEPLRCCLRNAKDGEDILLFGTSRLCRMRVPTGRSVLSMRTPLNASVGAPTVGVRRTGTGGPRSCARMTGQGGYIRRRRRTTGEIPSRQSRQFSLTQRSSRYTVVTSHSRNIAYGCFMFVVRREAV